MSWAPMLALALLVGVGLRVGVAWAAADHASEWEADGFVRAFEALPFHNLNHMRPSLPGWVFHQIAERASLQAILAVRLSGVALSVAALGCAMLLALALTGMTRAARRSRGFALAWMTGVWAVAPTLFSSASQPTAETLLGGVLCLLAAAVVAWGRRPGLWTWLMLTAAVGLALLTGGVVVLAALGAGLVVYLLPVPRAGVALPLLGAVALGLGGAAWIATAGELDPSAPADLLDAAPAYALADLTDTPLALDGAESLHPDRSTQMVYAAAWKGMRKTGVVGLATAFARRLVLDQLSPRRFESLGSPMLAIGLLDVFLRGGLLLFAAATFTLVRRRDESGFPRAGVVVALVLLIVLSVLCASSPFAFAPLDLLLLAIAAAGVAGADPDRPGVRWLAFGVGGVMLGALGLGAGLADLPLSRWASDLTQEAHQGRQLVEWLEDGGPQDAPGHLTCAYLMLDASAPFLRLPEAASRHAQAALELDPSSRAVIATVVKSEVANLRLDEAERLAGSMLDAVGAQSPDGRLLTEWIREIRSRQLASPRSGSGR